MKKHFNKENFQKFTKFSSQILTKTVQKDSLVSKNAICKASVRDLNWLRDAEHLKKYLGSRS
jgi:hypothetical protein